VGAKGMQAGISDENSMYVMDWSPSSEAHYRARFYFDPNSLGMADGDSFTFFTLFNVNNDVLATLKMRFSNGDCQIAHI
jgi:hypothetical protein